MIRLAMCAAALMLLGCASDTSLAVDSDEARGRSEVPARKSTQHPLGADRGKFTLGPDVTVCATATVDQRLRADDGRDFGSYLVGELGSNYRRMRPGSDWQPSDGSRFAVRYADDGRDITRCLDAQDIQIVVNYLPRADGGPYVMHYRIVQGDTVREGSFDRDLGADWRAGKSGVLTGMDALLFALIDDISARAPTLLNIILGEAKPD